jgi:RNA-binding protein
MLSSKQRSHLAGLAQSLEPLLHLGKAGASAGVETQLDRLLSEHELVKVRFIDFKESKHELAQDLARKAGGDLVRVIGNVAVIYRRNPDPQKQKIHFDFDED